MVTLFVITKQWTHPMVHQQGILKLLDSSAKDYHEAVCLCHLPVCTDRRAYEIGSDNGHGASCSGRRIHKHCLQQGQLLEMVFNRYISVTGGKNVILIVEDLNLSHS